MSDYTNEIDDDGRLEIEFPNCWIIVKETVTNDDDDTGKSQSLMVFTNQETGENYIAVFSDLEGAEDFIECASFGGIAVFQLMTPDDLRQAVIGARDKMEVKHVAIDLAIRPKIRGDFWPVEEAIEAIQGAK